MDLFNADRAIKGHITPADPAALENSPVGKQYCKIDPKSSVLLYDCGTACNENFAPGFEFLNIRGAFDLIKTYAAGVDGSGKPSAETLFTSWYDEARAKGMDESLSDIFHDNPATLGSFQLLAVANRMDMAQWDGQKWIHAEVHMAYGLTPEPDGSPINLTVIVEFELCTFADEDFRKLAQQWIALPPSTDAAYPNELKAALQKSGLPYDGSGKFVAARVRINHDIKGFEWRLTQVELKPDATGFQRRRLDDQIDPDRLRESPLWLAAQAGIKNGAYRVEDPYLGKDASLPYTNQPPGIGPPQGLCGIAPATRHVLAIQQCTGCHTVETGTGFKHISNRRRNEAASISAFLAGKYNDPKPKLADLWVPDMNVVQGAKVTYTAYSGGGCTTPSQSSETRAFHDIARRSLFLAAVATGVLPDKTRRYPQSQPYSTHGVE